MALGGGGPTNVKFCITPPGQPFHVIGAKLAANVALEHEVTLPLDMVVK